MFDDRRGDWMQTASGRMFWPIDPRPEEVCIEDIAHALSHICRYNGHCRAPYYVSQHSVLVARHVSEQNRLWALLHDASEAYVLDVPRPLKPSLTGYREIEARVQAAICERFGLPVEMPAEVTRVDNAILVDEMTQMMAAPPAPWGLREPPLGIEIEPWSPEQARAEFLGLFRDLAPADSGEGA